MSQSQQSHSEPTQEDWDWYNEQSMYIGFVQKPNVDHLDEPLDKHAWKRREVANRLKMDDRELADEPDHLRIDEQGYE